MSREAAAALICKLGCLTELLQSRARANVPTALRKPNTDENSKPATPLRKSYLFMLWYEYLAYTHVRAPHAWLLQEEAREGRRIPWNCPAGAASTLTTETSLQPLSPSLLSRAGINTMNKSNSGRGVYLLAWVPSQVHHLGKLWQEL